MVGGVLIILGVAVWRVVAFSLEYLSWGGSWDFIVGLAVLVALCLVAGALMGREN